jgi:hypothetical protein
MSECSWVGLVEDAVTFRRSQVWFRYGATVSEEDAALALQRTLNASEAINVYVLDATTNLSKWKEHPILTTM